MFDQPELEALLRANLTQHPTVTIRRQHRGHRRHPGRRRTGAGRRHRPGAPDVEDTVARRVRARLRRRQQPRPGCRSAPSMRDLQLRTALARRRRRRPTPTSASGRACTRSATRSAPRPTCGSAPTRYRWEFRLRRRRDRRRLPRHRPAAPAAAPRGPGTCRSTGCEIVPGGRVHLPRPASPTAGATGGSSCSATPPTSPRRSSARAWAPGCATRPTSPGSSPACSPASLPATRPGHLRGRTQAARPRLIRLAKLVGTAMTAGGELGNLLRRVVAPRLHLLPGVRDHVLNSETPTLHRSGLVQPAAAAPLAGRPAVPERPARGRPPLRRRGRRPVRARHDRRAGHRPARRGASSAAASLSRPRDGSALHQWLRNGHARAAVVRPDGTVLRAGRDLSRLCSAVPPFTAPSARLQHATAH